LLATSWPSPESLQTAGTSLDGLLANWSMLGAQSEPI
jgi:hypothetical protein